jgi:ABC-type lipoprotein export system ATPase subunit
MLGIRGSKKKPIDLLKVMTDVNEIRSRHYRHPYLRRIGPDAWEDRRHGRILHTDEVLMNYGDEYLDEFLIREMKLPEWVEERIEKNRVSLIKTQRLLYIGDRDRDRDREVAPIKTVEKYSSELSRLIKSHLAQSTDLSSKLDRTYPNRLIKRISKADNIDTSEITKELNELELKRELLDKVGLIEIDKESSLLKIEDNSDDNNTLNHVLKLYVEDSFQKLEIFDELSSKIEILKHKKLYVNKENGFLFKSTIIFDQDKTPQVIPVEKLSSGEQNELVLFYELLFKSEKDSLILIDEPEISLHISWQNTFIEDLKEIARLNNLEILIATHSPDIISNNWDLRVELKGIE